MIQFFLKQVSGRMIKLFQMVYLYALLSIDGERVYSDLGDRSALCT